jgi:hypothetical protein
MPATTIQDPVDGETLVATEPQLQQTTDNSVWRERLNLFTGRALTDTALENEQLYRSSLLSTLGQSVSAGTVKGLALSLDPTGTVLILTPGYGIMPTGQDVVLNSTLKTPIRSLTVATPPVTPILANYAPNALTTAAALPNVGAWQGIAGSPFAGVLVLQPVLAEVSGQQMDTTGLPQIVSGNLGASCAQDPSEYSFEDWQVADAVQLVFMPWPAGVANLALPALTPQTTLRNRLAYTIFTAESMLGPDDVLPWATQGVPVGLIAFDNTTSWKTLFLDCSSVVRAGGLPRKRVLIPWQPIAQPALAQAQVYQLSEQLSQMLAQGESITNLSAYFPTLPPSGILPVKALNLTSLSNPSAPWLPPNWSLTGAPVKMEELESVLETGMSLAPLAAATTAPADPKNLEPVEILIPLPDALYDPNILIVDTVPPAFQQELDAATAARNLVLQQIATVQNKLNALFLVIGPNLPANTSLIDPNAGLTADEIVGRNTPPPYLPTAAETLGTVLQSTWIASNPYTVGQYAIDSNGNLQVVTVAGTAGTKNPTWATSVAQTTTDGAVTWLNNGPWSWQPNTAYVVGQFVVDPQGYRQSVTVAGISAASAPTWSDGSGKTTPDGIVWHAGGKALWKPDTLYSIGNLILDTTGNVQIVQSGGISGDAAPPWNVTVGQTTTDNGVVWQCLGFNKWQANSSYAAGQAIVDPSGVIQMVQVGGTSGNQQPVWNEDGTTVTTDAAITWTNAGSINWQSGTHYAAGSIVLDANGNLQTTATAGTAGSKTPAWSTTPGATTTEIGTSTVAAPSWQNMAYQSTDLLQLLALAPSSGTFVNASGATTTVPLLSATDLAMLASGGNGLQALITSLNARINGANDLLDTGFLTAQTDLYRYRQNVLGSVAASTLATSPILANIATGDTSSATAANLQGYLNTILPASNPSTVSPSATAPASASPVNFQSFASRLRVGTTVFSSVLQSAPSAPAVTKSLRTEAVTRIVNKTPSTPTNGTFPVNSPVVNKTLPDIGIAGVGAARIGSANLESIVLKAVNFTSPTRIIIPNETVTATAEDITSQSPLPGAQLNLRTLTIAQRLQQSPSQEAMFYSIANRLNFLQSLQTLASDLNLVVDDLSILVDDTSGTPAAATATTPPGAIPTKSYTFFQFRTDTQGTTVAPAIQQPYLSNDLSEASLFSVGIRVLEQHTMLLRAIEGRVQQYSDFVAQCQMALSNMQSDIQQGQTYLSQRNNHLLQTRQNVAFTAALLSDETALVVSTNAQRTQILTTQVQIVAYTRARTLAATDTAPSRQLLPANITNPVPACLQQTVSVPPELREIIGQLREAPVNWIPAAASLVVKLQRPVLLQQLALDVQSRAILMMQSTLLPSSAQGEAGVYASAIARVYSANQTISRSFQVQRASFQLASLTSMSWSLQVYNVQNNAALNDLISSQGVPTEVSNAVARIIQQVSSVSTCLYTRVSAADPINRLAWANYLTTSGASVALQSLAILPGWNGLNYTDRQQMQLLVDWLFQQIDTINAQATAFMSDVVRTAILLASDVPLDNIIPGAVIQRVLPTIGGLVTLNLSSDRIAAGMVVNLYSAGNLAARAVVSDLDSRTVSATVTNVYSPGTYLNTNDTAHFTAQTPLAVAMRSVFGQS